MLTGSCQCGEVRFEADGPVEDFSHCHCSICRRVHGAPYVSWGGVPKAGFRYLYGEELLTRYASSDDIDRYFCSRCGSHLLCDFKAEPHMLYLALGVVEGGPDLPQGYHFFMNFKAPWVRINDGLPQYPEWPPGEGSWKD